MWALPSGRGFPVQLLKKLQDNGVLYYLCLYSLKAAAACRSTPLTCLLLLLLLNVFDDAPVCRHVKDESWARAVTWRTTEMQVSKDEYVMTV